MTVLWWLVVILVVSPLFIGMYFIRKSRRGQVGPGR